jgi:leader peptidase (prepilin peptidase)/N-methyltransferase
MSALWLQLLAYLFAPMTWISFIFGSIVGSFLNVCIYRIPEGTFFAHARSRCRACGEAIPAYRNIPMVSWVLQGGKAACCGAKISVQYPIIELGTAVIFALIYWKVPFVEVKGAVIGWDFANLIRAIHMAIFSSLMIVCAAIDWRHMIIPDIISLPMVAVTPLLVWIHPDLDWLSALLGVATGFSVLYAIAWLYWLIRKEVGMGMGDVKLLAAIGGWLGVQSILPTILVGSLLGALYGIGLMIVTRSTNLRTALPFGPFLVAGALIHLFFGASIQEAFFLP